MALLSYKLQHTTVSGPSCCLVLHPEKHGVLDVQGRCVRDKRPSSGIYAPLDAAADPSCVPNRSSAEGGRMTLSPYSADCLSMKANGNAL